MYHGLIRLGVHLLHVNVLCRGHLRVPHLALDRLVGRRLAVMLDRGVTTAKHVIGDVWQSGLHPRWLQNVFCPIGRNNAASVAGGKNERLRVSVRVAVLLPSQDRL